MLECKRVCTDPPETPNKNILSLRGVVGSIQLGSEPFRLRPVDADVPEVRHQNLLPVRNTRREDVNEIGQQGHHLIHSVTTAGGEIN